MLEGFYYDHLDRQTDADGTVRFEVALRPDCAIYQGHFPHRPVAPAVCNIQLITECAERVANRPLLLRHIALCKLKQLISPASHPRLAVTIRLTEQTGNQIALRAAIGCGAEELATLRATYDMADQPPATPTAYTVR